jgi:hypothetical protein
MVLVLLVQPDEAVQYASVFEANGDREALSFRERDVDTGKRRLGRTRHDLSAMSTDHADSRFRGRPPFAPLAFAAVAFALDRRRPPRLSVDAANKRVPNARSTSPGTETSTSSEGHDNASPAGDSNTGSSFDADARSKPGTMARGMDIEPPPLNTSSIASAPETYRAFTTDEGSATRASPRARARPYRS